MNDIREKLRAFITRELMRDAKYKLTDTEVIPGRLIDSFALAELSVYIENEFAVYIPDADLTVEAMSTLNHMVARVEQG